MIKKCDSTPRALPPCPSFRGHRVRFKAGSIARGISNYHSRRRATDGDELYSGDKLALRDDANRFGMTGLGGWPALH